jgi:hypothetical protein
MAMRNSTRSTSNTRRGLLWLLVIPFIATLWVPFYQGATPALAGIPFFYWYQFLWVIITAVLTAVLFLVTG